MSWQILAVSLGAYVIFMVLIKRDSMAATSSLLFLVPPTTAIMATWFGDKDTAEHGRVCPGVGVYQFTLFITCNAIAWRSRGQRPQIIGLHLRFISIPQLQDKARAFLGPVNTQIPAASCCNRRPEARRMGWPLLAASINTDLQRVSSRSAKCRPAPAKEVTIAVGTASLASTASGTADTGGNSVSSQNFGTGEMRDITRRSTRHLPVIAVGGQPSLQQAPCLPSHWQPAVPAPQTDRRIDILRGHGTSTSKHMGHRLPTQMLLVVIATPPCCPCNVR